MPNFRTLFLREQCITKKLYLIDLVCHGVASPYMWRDYLRYLEGKYKKRIISVNFRDKSFGWHSHRESFCFNDGYTIYPYFPFIKTVCCVPHVVFVLLPV